MGCYPHNRQIKKHFLGQVSVELVLGIIILAGLVFFAIKIWSRVNTDMVSYVRWYEDKRDDPDWAGDPDATVLPVKDIDYSNIDKALSDLDKYIAELTADRKKYSDEAVQKRLEAAKIRRSGVRFRFLFITGYWYFPMQVWPLSRAAMMEAIFKEDLVSILDEKLIELKDKKEKIELAKALIADNKPDEAKAVIDTLEEHRSSEEIKQQEAAKLNSQADDLDREAKSLFAQAGDHWSKGYRVNTWNDKNQAIQDEALYEEAEAKSTVVDPLHDGAKIPGLAQVKRQQAEDILALDTSSNVDLGGQSDTEITQEEIDKLKAEIDKLKEQTGEPNAD